MGGSWGWSSILHSGVRSFESFRIIFTCAEECQPFLILLPDLFSTSAVLVMLHVFAAGLQQQIRVSFLACTHQPVVTVKCCLSLIPAWFSAGNEQWNDPELAHPLRGFLDSEIPKSGFPRPCPKPSILRWVDRILHHHHSIRLHAARSRALFLILGAENMLKEKKLNLLMLKRMWKHELCLKCLTIMAPAILAQALLLGSLNPTFAKKMRGITSEPTPNKQWPPRRLRQLPSS